MSSTTNLSRPRLLRKPASINATTNATYVTNNVPKVPNANQKENKSASSNNSNHDAAKPSPSRLPQIKPLTRSAAATTTTTSTSTSATTRARATGSTTTSKTKSTTTTTSGISKPLPSIFSSRNGLTATRRPSPSPSPTIDENTAAAARPLGRPLSTIHVPPTSSATKRSSSRDSSTTGRRPSSAESISTTATTKSRTLGPRQAKSTATKLTPNTTLKPPGSRISAPASTTASTKPQTRSQTLQARGTAHSTTNSSASSTVAAAAAAAPPSVAAATQNRPAFNTNQQHYSPAKSLAPKPLTSTFLAPPSPSKLPSNVAISAETARLQTELVQLSLLHRDAGTTAAEWHASAQHKLGARFEELVSAERALGDRERDLVEGRNATVLVQWGAARSGNEVVGGLEEKVQMLDQLVNGVWRFGEPGGRYARVVEEFEDWADRLQAIMEARREGDVNSLLEGGEVLFVGDLENRWRDECPGLARKLEEWRRMLCHLGPAPDGSGAAAAALTTMGQEGGGGLKPSLVRLLEGCAGMVDDMLAELALMEQVLQEAVRAEDDWIETMNKELNPDNENDTQGHGSAPLWKMVV